MFDVLLFHPTFLKLLYIKAIFIIPESPKQLQQTKPKQVKPKTSYAPVKLTNQMNEYFNCATLSVMKLLRNQPYRLRLQTCKIDRI